MSLLKYSKTGYYLKLTTSILAFIILPLFVYDGFLAERLDSSSKGANLIAVICYVAIGVMFLISALKEKKNLEPMKGCFITGIWTCSFLFSCFWSVMLCWVLLDRTGTKDLFSYVWAVISLFVAVSSFRELFINKMFRKSI